MTHCNRGLTALSVIAFFILFSTQAAAGTDALETLINKTLDEAKAAGAQHEQDEVGHFYIVEAEYDKIHKDGKAEHYPIQRPMVEPWGCNERPNMVAVTQKFESKEEQTNADGSEQYIAHALGQYNLDPSPSTEIAGVVVDKNNRPVKNAQVRAENVNKSMPPVVVQSDEQGKYALKVRSGQYRVTAKSKECEARPQTLWACTWGKVPGNTPAKERFPLDLVAECGDMTLNINGPYTVSVDIQVEGASFNGATNGGKVDGKIPLSLNSDTGEITGEGMLQYGAHTVKTHGAIEEITGLGGGKVDSSSLLVKVTGKLDASTGIATLTCACLEAGERTVNAEVTVTDGRHSVSSASGGTQASESCADPDWDMHFAIPWKAGASYKLDRTLHKAFEGGRLTNHEMFDLTLGDKKDDKADPPVEKKSGSDSNNGAGSGKSGGTQNKKGAVGGTGNAVPSANDDAGLLAGHSQKVKSAVKELPPADAEDASVPLDEEGNPIPMDQVPEEYKQLLRQLQNKSEN